MGERVTEADSLLTPARALLETVRRELDDPARWTQGVWGRDVCGSELENPTHPDAVCWCLDGALDRARALKLDANTYEWPTTLNNAKDMLVQQLKKRGERMRSGTYGLIASWNDEPHRTHADVLALLDETIGRARHFEAVRARRLHP